MIGKNYRPALQGEINYIVEILEDHTFGDNIFIPQLKGEGFHKQIIEGGNMMTYLDHNTNKLLRRLFRRTLI